MALVSARKNRLARALLRTRLTRNPQFFQWFSMIFVACCFIIPPILFVRQAIQIGTTQGWDAAFAWYAAEFFGEVSESGYTFVYVFTGIALLISLAWVLYIVITFIRYKLYKHPRFRRHPKGYSRELPSSEFHPVVVSRFLNERQLPDDIFIALLHLAALDVVQITGGLDESSPDYYLPSTKTGFFIHVRDISSSHSKLVERLPSAIDRAAFKVLKEIADSDGVLTLEQLEKAIEKDFLHSKNPLANFSRIASRELTKSQLIVKGNLMIQDGSISHLSRKWLARGLLASIPCLVFLLVCYLLNVGLLTWYFSFLPPVILLVLLWNLFEFDITDKGYRVLDECYACKRWMNDFTALRQVEAGATEAWDDYLTYAYVLEANETLVDDLRQIGSIVAEKLSSSFIAQNGRPHFWWSKKRRLAYEQKWNSTLEGLKS